MEIDTPATTMLPDRPLGSVLGATANPTVRVPLPLESPAKEIHDALLLALHEQSLRVATTREPVPPDAGKEALVTLTSYVQGTGAASICETVTVRPAMVSVPVRGAPLPLSVPL
jgi:hypothetical protein